MAALSYKLFCVSVILKNAVINSVIRGFWVQWVSYEGETLSDRKHDCSMTVQQIQLTHTGAAVKVRNFQNFAHGVGENNIKDTALGAGVFFEVLRRQNTRSSLKAFANYLNISTVKAEKHLYERAKKKKKG